MNPTPNEDKFEQFARQAQQSGNSNLVQPQPIPFVKNACVLSAADLTAQPVKPDMSTKEELYAVVLDEKQASLLGVEPGSCAFYHQRRTKTEDGRIYEICVSPNDVPGYDKDQYIDPAILETVPGGSYAYCDEMGNYYKAWFGLTY